MTNYIRRNASWIITAVVLVLFVWYALANQDIFAALSGVTWHWLVLIAAARLVMIVSNGLFTKWTVEVFTKKMSLGESFHVSVLTAVGNFFGPLFGGLGIRAVYLKKVHHLAYSKFTATLIGYYLVMFSLNSLLAIIGLVLLPSTGQTALLLLIFSVWLGVFIALAFLRLPSRKRFGGLVENRIGNAIYKVLSDIESGWKMLLTHKSLLVKMAVLATVNLLMIVLMTLVEFVALDIPVNIPAILLYSALVQVALLVSITPGSIGFREALLLIVATTLGVTAGEILQVAVIDRGVQFILIGILILATRNSKLKQRLTAKTT